jgi:hypothetical protein
MSWKIDAPCECCHANQDQNMTVAEEILDEPMVFAQHAGVMNTKSEGE